MVCVLWFHTYCDDALSHWRENLMSTLVIEHVKVSELPESWRARLTATRYARVTVRIEEEVSATVDVGPLRGRSGRSGALGCLYGTGARMPQLARVGTSEEGFEPPLGNGLGWAVGHKAFITL